MMNIVVTDGYTLNPGDLSWENIAAIGHLVVYDRTPPEKVFERCAEADIIVTNKVPVTAALIDACPRLKCICVVATGYNVIDVKAASERKIVLCNVPAYGTDSVAQHTFSLLLEMTNHVGKHARSVADGQWEHAPDWCYTLAPMQELAGKTLGIVGLGHIGRQVAAIAAAFKMPVIYYSRQAKEHPFASYCSLEHLFTQSDFITLHCPLTPDNKEFVNRSLLQRMKSSALLINTARGALINEQDLADALNSDQIAGAALDVLSVEPPTSGNPLLRAKNCIITPHNAWMSKEARQRIMSTTTKNIAAFLQGKPLNQVN
jgi:glycerate dehydrogenase